MRFEVVGLFEIWCGIIYFVRAGPGLWDPKFEHNWSGIVGDISIWSGLRLVEIQSG